MEHEPPPLDPDDLEYAASILLQHGVKALKNAVECRAANRHIELIKMHETTHARCLRVSRTFLIESEIIRKDMAHAD